jgi:hypothetical protein
MNQGKSRDWLQIAGNFSVVAGLILVALQINQSSNFVRAELGMHGTERYLMVDQTVADASFAAVWAKSYEHPADLTLAETIQIESYLRSLLSNLDGDNWLYELRIYEGNVDERSIPYVANIIGGNRFAMVWWGESKSDYDQTIIDKLDQYIANETSNFRIKRYERIKSRL